MNEQSKTWCPAIEFNETNEELILKAEVPGVKIEDLKIHAETDSILIAGIHDRDRSTAETEVIPSQLHYGQLKCNITLPAKIRVEAISAELTSGVLTITMPKLNVASTANL